MNKQNFRFHSTIVRCFLFSIIFAVTALCGERIVPSVSEESTIKSGGSDFRIEVEDTTTMVMIAKVYLSIGDLRYDDGYLVGNYNIEVPLRPSKSEGGTMRLNLDNTVRELFTSGGEISGIGKSFKEDKEDRVILCKVFPDDETLKEGTIKLEIHTGERLLKFESNFKVIGLPPEA